MSDISEILRRRKFGDEVLEVKNEEVVTTSDTSDNSNQTQNNQDVQIIYPTTEEIVPSTSKTIESIADGNLSSILQIDTVKNKISTTIKLDEIVNNIRLFEKYTNYSFFFKGHCFNKINEERIYKQKGYNNFVDFIKVELKEFSMKSVYNHINIAKTFPMEQITSDILDLGVTKLTHITKIEDSQIRLSYLLNNFDDIKDMSSRELDIRIAKLNNTKPQKSLPENYDDIVFKNLTELQDNALKLSLFLEDFRDKAEEKDYELLKIEIDEIEEKIKKIKKIFIQN